MPELTAAEMELRAKRFLVEMVKNYKVFIDTCSLLSDYADSFWEHLIPVLTAEKSNVVIPYRVYQEVEKYADNPELCQKKAPGNPNLNRAARHAKRRILDLHQKGLVRVLGDKTDNFADNVFQTVFTQYRMKYNMILITQDRNLAADILRIAESKAVTVSTKIQVRRINKHGYLSHIENLNGDNTVQKPGPGTTGRHVERKPQETSQPISADEIFAHTNRIAVTAGTIPVTLYPKEGSYVTAERGGRRKQVRLVKEGNSGGEGTIFETDIPNVVAKIYKPGKVDRAKFEKLKLMMTKNINCEGVCFPIALLYNSKDEFVGFLMNKARGKELQKCLFIPQLLKKYFPYWKKKDTVQLCITILKKFQYLHERNIILGDINPNNILVVSPTEVYFVDTDSYQVEGYPCPVGTINYTAPEIQRKKFDTFLRTMGNEKFAVATLLFMIMLPGKPPYSLQGGENQIDNIINGDFAYASGERTNGKAPEGVWRYVWSHLPRYLKDDFYETFRKGGLQSTESTRFSDGDWLKKFEHYAELLADPNGKFLQNDSMSAELFPTRLKKAINTNYVRCKLCGNEVDEERTEQGYCRECLRKGETYECARCGGEVVYTNYQKLIRRAKRFDTCKECNDHLNSVYKRYACANPRCRTPIEITFRYKENLESKGKSLPTVCRDCRDVAYSRNNRCVQCGKSFDLTYGDKEYFESKKLDLPKRCPDCRGTKSTPVSGSRTYTPTKTYHHPTPAPSQKSSLCFITTAVCGYLGKPDDCYELTTLRAFRDHWLAKQPEGRALVEEYYAIAPAIVTAIDGSAHKDRIYMHLWKDYIEPCVKLIELGANESCKRLYVDMVNELKNQFC